MRTPPAVATSPATPSAASLKRLSPTRRPSSSSTSPTAPPSSSQPLTARPWLIRRAASALPRAARTRCISTSRRCRHRLHRRSARELLAPRSALPNRPRRRAPCAGRWWRRCPRHGGGGSGSATCYSRWRQRQRQRADVDPRPRRCALSRHLHRHPGARRLRRHEECGHHSHRRAASPSCEGGAARRLPRRAQRACGRDDCGVCGGVHVRPTCVATRFLLGGGGGTDWTF